MEAETTIDGRCTEAARALEREAARARLARDYEIDSEFVRVPKLAKILGLAAPTIYESMREGRFFIPHRLLGAVPAVRLDDLARWYCEQPERPESRPASRPRAEPAKPALDVFAISERILEEMGETRRRSRVPRP